MKFNHSTSYTKVSILISSVIAASLIFQVSYGQLGEINFDALNPLTVNNSNSSAQQDGFSIYRNIPIATNIDGIYFIWESNIDGNSDILFVKRTSDGFDYLVNLSNSSGVDSINPNMVIDNRNIYFTWWESYDNGTQIPMFRATSDSGTTFGGTTALSELSFKETVRQ